MEGAMRECLAQGAWCDVRLTCGGREFRAHRVVLSSVSPFLRMLLKSRPDEDIPATIVMPEFEVEALSAVLHYVYNGEVSVPTQHLDAFFTIVKTLQICVDKTALIGFREKIGDFDSKLLDVEVFRKVITGRIVPALKNVHDVGVSITTPRHTPGPMESKQLDLENVIKGDRICKSVSPYLNESTFRERSASRQRWSEPSIPNPHSADFDRAPESPARDSTPRRPAPSGSNGPATCVPAITNIDNLGPTSPPVTNAALAGPMSRKIPNPVRVRGLAGRRQRVNNEPAGLPKRLECSKILPNVTFGNDLSQIGHRPDPHSEARLNINDVWRENCPVSPLTNGAVDGIKKPAVLRPVPTLVPLGPMYNLPLRTVVDRSGYFRPPPDLLDLSSPHLSRFDLLRSHSTEELGMSLLSNHLNGYSRSLSHSFEAYRASDDVRLCESSPREEVAEQAEGDRSFARRAAYNKVLAGPWCPRAPPTYCPAPPPPPPPPLIYTDPVLPSSLLQIQACERLSPSDSLVVDGEEKSSSDDNNNVREVRLPSPPGAVPPAPADPAPPNPHSIDAIIGKASGAAPMRCDTCDKVFTCRATLEAHARAHGGGGGGGGGGAGARHTCADCGKSFSQLRNFKYHVSVHRGTREFAATCNVCGKYFNDRGYLSSHMKIHRNRKEYECPHCPKSFNQRVAYNMHVRIHTGVKPHVCGECGKAFSRKMLLKQHQRTHSGERPYACSVCDKRFADRSNMTLHMRLHSGVKPFSCTLCTKSFTKKHHLKTHLNYHTGDKPYSCPRCRLAFSQSSNMRTHLKKCSATAPHAPAHPAAAAPPALPAPPAPAALDDRTL